MSYSQLSKRWPALAVLLLLISCNWIHAQMNGNLYNKASRLQAQANYESAAYYFEKTAEAAQNAKQWQIYVDAEAEKARSYLLSFRIDTARAVMNALIHTFETKPEFSGIQVAFAYQVYAQVLASQGKYQSAFSACIRASKATALILPTNKTVQASYYQQTGRMLLLLAKPGQAIPYFLQGRALIIAEYGPRHYSLAPLYEDIGQAYIDMLAPNKAMAYFEQALQLRRAGPKDKNHIKYWYSYAPLQSLV